jgi:hypothetical protein
MVFRTIAVHKKYITDPAPGIFPALAHFFHIFFISSLDTEHIRIRTWLLHIRHIIRIIIYTTRDIYSMVEYKELFFTHLKISFKEINF